MAEAMPFQSRVMKQLLEELRYSLFEDMDALGDAEAERAGEQALDRLVDRLLREFEGSKVHWDHMAGAEILSLIHI